MNAGLFISIGAHWDYYATKMKPPNTATPPDQVLREWAIHLDGIRKRRWFVRPFRDCMSDALVWRDETVGTTPVEVIWALRLLFHYRTGIIIGEPRPHGEFWQLGREIFPHWVGFHPSRCQFSLRLAEIYQCGKRNDNHWSAGSDSRDS